LGPLLFLAYLSNIWRNIGSAFRLTANDFVIYRKIVNDSDIEILRVDLNTLGEWAVENVMKINPGTSKAVSFARARVKDLLIIFFGGRG
jgi:hypothetical protein